MILPIVTDLHFLLEPLRSQLFPDYSENLKVHEGFADQHAKAAPQILEAVKAALDKSGFDKVAIVGHSLGAALAVLDSILLPPYFPGVSFSTFAYGLPRVGNQAFADYVDANLDLKRINNRKDPIPTLPAHLFGFVQPQGEIHIQADGSWIVCPGQDNPDVRCTRGDVPNILEWHPSDHDGPYDDVIMGTSSCST